MIHKFEFDDTKLVLDVHSGALHVVDELTWKILDHYQHQTQQEIINMYQQIYNPAEIQEVLEEIYLLTHQGLLFSSDPLAGEYQPAPGLVKALCLHVAHDCNLRCRYCFAGQGPFGGDRSLMFSETGRQAIDFLLKQSGARRNIEIDFFGGEPLLNLPLVKELVIYGREKAAALGKKIKFTLTTNALLLDEKVQKYLIDNKISVVLSLDGRSIIHDLMRPTPRGAGSYDKVLKSIKSFVEKKPPGGYYVRGTFTRHNLDFSKDVLHMINEGFVDISVEPVVAGPEEDYGLLEEHLDVLKQEYRQLTREIIQLHQQGKQINFFHFNIDLDGGPCLAKRLSGCGAGHEYMAVTPEGYLYPCHQFVGRPEFKIGDVSKGDLNQKTIEQFCAAHIYNKQGCATCWAKYQCSGGCHANAYTFNNSLLKPHSIGCKLAQIRLECALYLKAKLQENSD